MIRIHEIANVVVVEAEVAVAQVNLLLLTIPKVQLVPKVPMMKIRQSQIQLLTLRLLSVSAVAVVDPMGMALLLARLLKKMA